MDNKKPLFGCTSCYEDCSWSADDLREHEGELWCDQCWDGADMRETTGMYWGDLPAFVPREDKRIAELASQLAEAREALGVMVAAYGGGGVRVPLSEKVHAMSMACNALGEQ